MKTRDELFVEAVVTEIGSWAYGVEVEWSTWCHAFAMNRVKPPADRWSLFSKALEEANSRGLLSKSDVPGMIRRSEKSAVYAGAGVSVVGVSLQIDHGTFAKAGPLASPRLVAKIKLSDGSTTIWESGPLSSETLSLTKRA
jgi:hypothetical protein